MSLVVPLEEIFNEEGLLSKAPHWERVELGLAVSILNGFPLKSTAFNTVKGFPLIRIRDLKFNKVQTYYSEEFPKEYIVSDGDLLVGMDGDFICYEWSGGKAVLNQRVCKLQPNENYLLKRILFYGINGYLNAIQKATSSVTVGHLSSIDTGKIPFPLPPIQEQHRIVAKLDAVMQKVESNKQRLEKIPKLLKRFRQSVLAAAVSGKLTEDWRMKNASIEAVNPSEINKERERIQKENSKRKGQKTFKYKQPVEIELGERTKGVDELFELPEKWKWVSLDYCVWSVSDGPHFSPKYVEKENGIAFISSRNISYDKIDFGDAKYVREADHKEFIKRGKPEIDDVLLTKGGTTGIAHKVNTDIEFSIWVHVALLKVIKKYVDANYLRDVLTSNFLYKQSQAQTHGVGNQDLGLTRMIFMTIPLPPFEEQKEIVRRVIRLFAFADKIEARYTKAKTMINKLPQSILAKAFRGGLVPQNPNDEPASVLLERVKAEKEKLKTKKNHKL